MPKIYMKAPYGAIFTTTNVEWHKDSEKLSVVKGKVMLAEQSKATLLKLLEGHPTIYVIIRSVAASGMSRTMDFYTIQGEHFRRITPLFCDVLGWGETPGGALKVHGCGMDMAWHSCYTVYSIIGLDTKSVKNAIL